MSNVPEFDQTAGATGVFLPLAVANPVSGRLMPAPPQSRVAAHSAVGICSSALMLIGDKAITDFNEATDRARLCRQFYAEVAEDLLVGEDWGFASQRVQQLTPVGEMEHILWDYKFCYELPSDCLRVRETSLDIQTHGEGQRWAIEGRRLVADDSPVAIRYTGRKAEGDWPPFFVTAVIYELAARLAYPLTQKPALAQQQAQLAELKLRAARAKDGQQHSPRKVITTALTQVRLLCG